MSASARKRSELAKIHIAKKDLGLDDSTYRDLLWTVARVRSSADLDSYGRGRVLEHFKSLGWKPRPKPARNAGRPHNYEQRPLLRKIGALLAEGRLPWKYANSIAKRMFHVETVAFCTDEQLNKIVPALVKKLERAGETKQTGEQQ